MNKSEETLAKKSARTQAAATKKPAKTLYDVAIKNGWGPQIRLIPGSVARLKKTPA